MIQTLKKISFEEFLAEYPEDGQRYELIDGVITLIQAKGKHGIIGGFLLSKLSQEIEREKFPYAIPLLCCIKPDYPLNGYIPELVILKTELLADEPYWESASTITRGDTAALVVEIVSTNWRDDYDRKLKAYQDLGIKEYWIVDYKPFGKGIKHPTLTVYILIDSKYEQQRYQGDQVIKSSVFTNLKLTANQIFQARFSFG